jgi:hypothetical protein
MTGKITEDTASGGVSQRFLRFTPYSPCNSVYSVVKLLLTWPNRGSDSYNFTDYPCFSAWSVAKCRIADARYVMPQNKT